MKLAIFVIFFALTFTLTTQAEIGPRPLSERIVVLSPALTEILFELGEGHRIVGVTEFSDYPEAAKKIPRVGSYVAPTLEKILALKPGDVLMANEGVDSISNPLQDAHILTRIYTMKSLKDFESTVSDLAFRTQKDEPANKILTKWRNDWKKVESEKSDHKVVIQVDHDPIFIAGANTFLSELVERCGATNDLKVFSNYDQPTLERLTQVKADVILVTAQIKDVGFKKRVEEFWAKQPLKQKPKVLFFDPDKISRLAPRLPSAALELCKELKAIK